MKKLRQILAILGVILLVGLYVLTFLTAIFDDPNSFTYFKAALAATIAVPVILWFLGMFLRLSKRDDDALPPPENDAEDAHPSTEDDAS